MKAEHLDVVRHVAYDGNVAWIDDTDDAAQEPRAADAAREDGDLHAADSQVEGREHAPGVRAEPAGEPREIVERVHVIDEIRRVEHASTAPSAANRSALPGP